MAERIGAPSGFPAQGSQEVGEVVGGRRPLEVKTNRGSSSWDGFHRQMVDVEAPPTFSLSEADAAWRKQVARLEESMAARLDTIEPQTLTAAP